MFGAGLGCDVSPGMFSLGAPKASRAWGIIPSLPSQPTSAGFCQGTHTQVLFAFAGWLWSWIFILQCLEEQPQSCSQHESAAALTAAGILEPALLGCFSSEEHEQHPRDVGRSPEHDRVAEQRLNKDIFVHASHTDLKEEQGDVVLNQELALQILEAQETKSHFFFFFLISKTSLFLAQATSPRKTGLEKCGFSLDICNIHGNAALLKSGGSRVELSFVKALSRTKFMPGKLPARVLGMAGTFCGNVSPHPELRKETLLNIPKAGEGMGLSSTGCAPAGAKFGWGWLNVVQ